MISNFLLKIFHIYIIQQKNHIYMTYTVYVFILAIIFCIFELVVYLCYTSWTSFSAVRYQLVLYIPSMLVKQVPEESRLVFRAPAFSLECCCFVSNDEFLSGSDDGSIELWSTLRKKPVDIVKNAHVSLGANKILESKNGGKTPNGHIGKLQYFVSIWFIVKTACKVYHEAISILVYLVLLYLDVGKDFCSQ